ncbi:hypothetical protein B0H11DRAFT_2115011 [Mycena galericulata]|nr:hypothetical protein B0H11DRAFT_2115011 [Mycena galericulata]
MNRKGLVSINRTDAARFPPLPYTLPTWSVFRFGHGSLRGSYARPRHKSPRLTPQPSQNHLDLPSLPTRRHTNSVAQLVSDSAYCKSPSILHVSNDPCWSSASLCPSSGTPRLSLRMNPRARLISPRSLSPSPVVRRTHPPDHSPFADLCFSNQLFFFLFSLLKSQPHLSRLIIVDMISHHWTTGRMQGNSCRLLLFEIRAPSDFESSRDLRIVSSPSLPHSRTHAPSPARM